MEAIDLLSPRLFANPYPAYRQMRDAAPLIGLRPGSWATGRYTVADLLLRDRRAGRNFIERSRALYGEQAIKGEVFQSFGQTLLLMNPPSHTRLRALLSKAFNAEQMDGFQRLAQQNAHRLVDRLEQMSGANLVQAYAYPLPLGVICALLDMPGKDAPVLTDGSRAAIRAIEVHPMTPSQIDEANAAVRKLYAYFTDVIEQRRSRPGNDLISLLLTVREGKESLADEEIIANVMMLFIAGYETTSSMICNALITLHRHPNGSVR
jgi:cytochrome P450